MSEEFFGSADQGSPLEDVFMIKFKVWSDLLNCEVPQISGETVRQSDARGEQIGLLFQEAESWILACIPTRPVEVYGMLQVIAAAEWLSEEIRQAIANIQAWLSLNSLQAKVLDAGSQIGLSHSMSAA